MAGVATSRAKQSASIATGRTIRSLAAFAPVSSRWWPGGGTRGAPAYGVALGGRTRWSEVSTATGDTVAGIVAATPHRATAIRFVQWLLQA